MSSVVQIPQAQTSRQILGTRVDATSYELASSKACAWARHAESRYISTAPVYNVMLAYDDPAYHQALSGADLVVPDGVPVVWALRLLGARHAARVYGPDLTLHLLAAAQHLNLPVGFYGGTPQVLDLLLLNLRTRFPQLNIAYAFAPPFRPPTPSEDLETIGQIRDSGARLLFVGIGTPKQDFWMAQHHGRIPAVMVGVGAAFDFLAGAKPQAPRWMMRSGLEWLFRLASEPRRLWKRYLLYNPRFVALFALQLLGWQRGDQSR
ncbi:WecB/TagA/CpsF family glycosyltransferase [Paludibaculum fermentans]|uniref:WecB/TagA/CpsF family glycosyltransferase n=1 Tax=Paludibaculum fermentans TaxID=1473598 RepID=UPI003EBDF90F